MKRNIIRLGTVVVLILSLFTSYIIQPLPAKAEAAPTTGNSYIVPGKVIVKFKEETPPSSGTNIMGYSAKSLDHVSPKYKVVDIPNGSSVTLAVDELKAHPDVEYAEPVFVNKMTAGPSIPTMSAAVQSAAAVQTSDTEVAKQWGLGVTNITYAWDKTPTRDQLKIAVLDTGVNGTHPDLQGQVVDGYDFISDKPIAAGANSDDNGHGTFVAGVAAALTNNSQGVAGVAGGALIMPVKILDSGGGGDSDLLGSAISWAADHGAKVINLSLGRPHYGVLGGSVYDLFSRYEFDAVQYAVSKGAVVIAASGNESNHWVPGDPQNSAVGYPAALPNAIAVGAIQQVNGELSIADYSNIGPQLDVVAPGTDIWSTNRNGGYSSESGTSFSTPFVSGMAALLLAANAAMTPTEIESVLKDSSSVTGLQKPDANSGLTDADYFGRGLVNGKQAFALTRLKLEHKSGTLGAIDTLNLKLSTTDYEGKVTQNVYGDAKVIVSAYNPAKKDYVEVKHTVVASTYFDLFSVPLEDVGAYRITAEVSDQTGTLHSGAVESLIAPGSVVASPGSVTFKGSTQVALTSATPGAAIYYTLDGTDPAVSDFTATYNGPFTLSSSATLKAVAAKNGVASPTSTYTYIRASSGGGGGGGGGGSGFFAPASTTGTSSAAVVVKADDEQLKSALEAAGTQVTIDAKAGGSAETLRVEFGASILKLAADKNKSVVIDTGRQVFEFPPGAVDVKDTTATAAFVVNSSDGAAALNKKPAQTKDISKAYDFSLSLGTESITRFSKPIAIQWKLAAIGANPAKLGAYYFNENLQSWSYMGGKANLDGISFTTDHFSRFAVLEYNKTFEDMMQHWARNEVELLASKYIVNGITDATFGPEQKLTRAEFAALLVRMLGVQKIGNTGIFTDVNPDDWFHNVVYQAYGAGLIEGMDASTFAPSQPITREQMAVMIIRAYAIAAGKPTADTAGGAQQVTFTDADTIGSWARSSVLLTNGLGLMEGFPDGSFKPGETATRAQAAAVSKRLLDNIQK